MPNNAKLCMEGISHQRTNPQISKWFVLSERTDCELNIAICEASHLRVCAN